MILPDYPIENKEQDQLKRFPLAAKVAAMISAFTGKESFVIGIEGMWGSGKTSFINLVLGQLDKNSIVYFTFNPWNFSDEASLLRDFFIKFAAAVEGITGKSTGKRVKEYAGKLSEVDLGISYEGISINLFKLFKYWSPDTSLEAIRKELDEALARIEKKIVVVIDDIDRLDKKETKLILKLVKLTADFPKTIFILAYDRARVEDRITEKESGLEGGEYLKKIIQVSFTLPAPDQQELWSLLFKDLDSSLVAVHGTAELLGNEETRWHELFQSGFNELFRTIRDIKRYISSLRLDWSIVGKSDVNKIDFLGIEAVRVFAPRFYDAIPAHKELFIAWGSSYLRRLGRHGNETAEANRKQYEELLRHLIDDTAVRASIDGICKLLFPQLESNSMRTSDEWERELRICSADRFGFYFQLGIPFGEMSETEIDDVVASLADENAFKALIIQLKDANRLRKVLGKLLHRRESIDEGKLKTALKVLWELEKQIDDDREAVFDVDDTDTQIQRLAYFTLKELPVPNRKTLLAGLIHSCPNIFFPAHFIAVLRQDLEKHTGDTAVLCDADLRELEGILLSKIETAAKNGSLKDEKHLVGLLYRWHAWGSEEAVTDYVRSLISTRPGLLTFLKAFVSKVISTAGNYNNLNRHSVGELYPIAEIEALVDAITDDELAQMTREEKEAIDLFKHPRR
jgi:predicted KAP-like P-loop ATPase